MDRTLFIFDLDGVIYRGDAVMPHAAECIHRLSKCGHLVYYLTNNASKTRQSVADKLTGMGIPTAAWQVMNSSFGTALWFKEYGHVGKKVMIIGEEGCFEELNAGGMATVEPAASVCADFVVVGIDRQFSYQKLMHVQQAILNGATFIATNRDPTFPYEDGVAPGGGSLVAAVATSVGREPIVIGKPEIYCINQIIRLAGVPREHAVMVGDRLDTDIAVGNRADVRTVLVMGGVTSMEEAESAEGEERPSRIIENLSELN